ncbi:MAG: acetylornithine/succinylornithine family transaminase [Kiritimatiellae bacterium]|nr:acetylornithine/succinylornithine family transaminase [Kiritimatiellia bacterium]
MNDKQSIKDAYGTYLVPTYAPALTLVRGEGMHVWDEGGKEYLDFLAGIAVLCLGHAHPAWVEAVREQAGVLTHVSNLHAHPLQAKLARVLTEKFVPGSRVFFSNSGAEANEALIKVARKWGSASGRHEIITMKNSFHGRTLATLTATGQEKVQTGFAPLPTGFSYATFNDIASVKALVTDQTVAILLEVIQAEGGVVPGDVEFLHEVEALCHDRDLLLLIDDVQCGMGRLGTWFGFQAYGLRPDAFSLAKGLGGGFPIGAMVASPKLAEVLQPGTHGTTYGGNALACAAALAVLETIEKEALLNRTQAMGERFRNALTAMMPEFPFITEVRGMGWLIGVVLDRPAKPLETRMFQEGLIAVATAGNVIRFVPPLIAEEADVDEAVARFRAACRAWKTEQEPMEK